MSTRVALPQRGESASDGTATEPGGPELTGRAALRLSPRVKRLLREHDVDLTEVTGTGAGGRPTPDDVVRAATQRRGPGRLSPLVKRLLREHDLDPAEVTGSGTDGRITPDDVRRSAERIAATRSAPAAPPAAAPATTTTVAASPDRRVEPLTGARSLIAERMLASLQTTAQLTAAVEADVTRIMHARSRYAEHYRSRYGGSLSPLAFINRALCRTLLRHPLLNASIDTEAGQATYHRSVNLGIAVDAPDGLVIPNVRDAQDLTVAGLQRRITDLADRARTRQLRPDEVTGGTFTVTDTGAHGSLFDTPILNPPEVGILATPTIERRPVVVEDEHGGERIAVRHRTYLCLTYDHRLVDGADAARFLSDLAADLDGDHWDHELAELA